MLLDTYDTAIYLQSFLYYFVCFYALVFFHSMCMFVLSVQDDISSVHLASVYMFSKFNIQHVLNCGSFLLGCEGSQYDINMKNSGMLISYYIQFVLISLFYMNNMFLVCYVFIITHSITLCGASSNAFSICVKHIISIILFFMPATFSR